MNKLSAIDAFFLAYHKARPLLMHLGAEFHIQGAIEDHHVQQAIEALNDQWPDALSGVVLSTRWPKWKPMFKAQEALVIAETVEDWSTQRQVAINPNTTPPLKCVWFAQSPNQHKLSIYVHHALIDGEGFFCMAQWLIESIKTQLTGNTLDEKVLQPTWMPQPKFGLLEKARRLKSQLQYKHWFDQQATSSDYASCALRQQTPGPLVLSQKRINHTTRTHLLQIANTHKIRPSWLVLAAWFKALYQWNQSMGDDNPMLSMEVPVSLRYKSIGLRSGNHVSQVVLGDDASKELVDLAKSLKAQFSALVKSGAHEAIAQLAKPGEALPWPVYEKLATVPTTDGFATGVFVWLERQQNWVSRSEPLTISSYDVMTPACLKTGSSLCCIAWPDHLDICLTYMASSFHKDDAAQQLAWLSDALSMMS